MKFGFDIDDTIVETYPLLERKAKELFDICLPFPNNFSVLQDNMDETTLRKLVSHCFNDLSLMEENKDCVNFIKYLYENNIQNEFPFITARPDDTKEKTEEMLDNILGNITSNVKLTICKKSKIESVKEEGITHYIEDRWKYARELADNEVKVFLRLKPWNRHSRRLYHPNIIPFRNFEYIKYKMFLE